MTLRIKTLITVGVTLAVLLFVLYEAVRPVVMGEFARLEDHNARERVARTQEVLSNSLDDFGVRFQDYSNWDDAFAFVTNGSDSFQDQFIASNLGTGSLASMQVNMVAFLTKNGDVRFATMFDEHSKPQTASIPDEISSHFSPQDPLLQFKDARDTHTGLIMLPDGPLMVAVLPITPSESKTPIGGCMMVGRYLNRSNWLNYLRTDGQTIELRSIQDGLTPNFAAARDKLVQSPSNAWIKPEDNEIAGYTLLRDYFGQPIALLRVAVPLEVAARTQFTLSSIGAIIGVCGLLLLLLTLLPVEFFILTRLARLNRLVEDVRVGGDLSKRLDERGDDEISQLATNINRTFSALQSVATRQKRSERIYQQMAETALSAGDAYFVWEAGQDFLDWHGDIDALLGYPPGGMKRTQKAWLQHIHFVDQGKVVRACARALALNQPVQIEFRVIRCDGTTRHWMIRGKPLVPDKNTPRSSIGGITLAASDGDNSPRLLAVCIDITARKQSEEALRQSEERLQRIFDTAADAIVIADRDGQITFANEAAARIFGLLREEITSRTTDDAAWEYNDLEGEPFEISKRPFHRVRATGEPLYEVQYSVARDDGSRVIVSVNAAPLLDARGNFAGMVSSVSDVTERRALQDRLFYQAFHDSLTGLANRSLLRNRLEHALVRRTKEDNPVAVLFVDLDNFKYINDSLGHAAGDELIVAISNRLRLSLRAGDTAARFGGDEFVVLMEDVESPHYAIQVAERLLEALREPFFLSGREVFTTPSIGIAFSTGGYDHPDEMLRHADAAMYEAKRRGKARYEVFQSSMSASAINRLEIENDLRRALQKGEFFLHYQPKWSLETNEVTGFEALVRWNHPQRGLVSPGEFIPIAEETGLIVPLGFQVLKTACEQAHQWYHNTSKPLTMAINVSARQLTMPEIVPLVAQALEESQISPGCLILEITESAIVERTGPMLDTLNALKALGVRLAIDDFGTGYSSLAYLRAFPFDYLKIDRQFVTNVHEEGGNGAIVSSMITLAHALNLFVIAEGAEQPEEVAHLRKLGCDLAQGYYFGRPMAAAEIEAKFGFVSSGTERVLMSV